MRRKTIDEVEDVRASVGARLERVVRLVHKRYLQKLEARLPKAEFQPRGQWKAALEDPEFGELLSDDEELELRDFIKRSVKVTFSIVDSEAEYEGLKTDKGTSKREAKENRALQAQTRYVQSLIQDQDQEYSKVVADTVKESGPDLNAITEALEDELGYNVARARTIAVTETGKAFVGAYADTLQDNGYTHVKWKLIREGAGKEEGVCEICQNLEGQVLPIWIATSIFPPHPNCRCYLEAYEGPSAAYLREAWPITKRTAVRRFGDPDAFEALYAKETIYPYHGTGVCC